MKHIFLALEVITTPFLKKKTHLPCCLSTVYLLSVYLPCCLSTFVFIIIFVFFSLAICKTLCMFLYVLDYVPCIPSRSKFIMLLCASRFQVSLCPKFWVTSFHAFIPLFSLHPLFCFLYLSSAAPLELLDIAMSTATVANYVPASSQKFIVLDAMSFM